MKTRRLPYPSMGASRWSGRAGRRTIQGLGLLLVLLLAAVPALAASYDLTTAGASTTINGAIFLQWFDPDGAGTGNFDSFLRIQKNGTEHGYNTDGTLEFDTKGGLFTHSLLLSAVPTTNIGGTVYREFQLDVNESANTPLLSLEELQLFTANSATLTGYAAGPPPAIGGATTLVYDLDADEDNTVTLNYALNNGSGWADYVVLVPDSGFGSDPNCAFQGTGCTTYVYLYAQMGDDDGLASDDGFEEWAVSTEGTLLASGTIIVEKQTDPDAATDTFTFTGDAAGSISDGGQIVVGNLLPGTYTSQEAMLAGWDLTAIVCDDANSSGDVGTRTATFNLEAGETVKCTFENTMQGSITIKKVTNPEGGAGFPFESDTLGPFNLNDGGEITFSALSAGDDHTVTEVVPEGWNLNSIVCSYSSTDTAVDAVRDGSKLAGVTIQLGAGDNIHCTFNNEEEEPTAITLASFTAEPDAEGVTLAWETAAEIDNAGFNLYRAAAPDGPYVKINGALIAAQGSPASGASYSFVDEGLAPGTYTYKLEDVDLNGVATLHGPFSTTLQPNIRRPSYRPTVPD